MKQISKIGGRSVRGRDCEQHATVSLRDKTELPALPDDFGACKKIEIMASSNIFLRKDAPNWQLFNIKR